MFASPWQGILPISARTPAMNWSAPIDHYCERTDPSFWSEPLNAASNAAFIVAALLAFGLWRRAGSRDGAALFLIVVTTAVGIGSFLFHTLANRWSLLADVLPIAVFIYSYFLISMRRYVGLNAAAAAAATLAFFAFNVGFEWVWERVSGGLTLNGSVGYLPAASALMGVGAVVRRRAPLTSRALLLAAAVFLVSLTFRTFDKAVCGSLPIGLHYFWHGLNAVVLFILMRAAIQHGASARAAQA
jgi:hypothetical protein